MSWLAGDRFSRSYRLSCDLRPVIETKPTASPPRASGRAFGSPLAGDNQHFRVLDVVSFEKEDESPFVGLLQVEAA